jgi:hypothetical protein
VEPTSGLAKIASTFKRKVKGDRELICVPDCHMRKAGSPLGRAPLR